MLMFGTIKQLLGSSAGLFAVIQLVKIALIHVQHVPWPLVFRFISTGRIYFWSNYPYQLRFTVVLLQILHKKWPKLVHMNGMCKCGKNQVNGIAQ